MEDKFEQKTSGILNHLKAALQSIRTGRATPSLVENVLINAYGTKTPLVQMASINAPDPKSIVIEPYDQSIIKAIEDSLRQSNLGLNPTNEGRLIRLNLPPLTEEDREKFARLADQHLEESKVAMRNVREEILKSIKNQEKNKEISEDQSFQDQKKLQEKVDQFNKQIEEIAKKKREEIMSL